MNSVFIVLVLACSLKCVLCQIDCTNKPDGAYGSGCRSYTKCTGGVANIVDCRVNVEAFNYKTGQCEPIADVPLPCGSLDNDCDKKADGRYAVLPDCTYFYTCYNHLFYGASPCNNPPDSGLLVYNADNRVCDWRSNVKKPCGLM